MMHTVFDHFTYNLLSDISALCVRDLEWSLINILHLVISSFLSVGYLFTKGILQIQLSGAVLKREMAVGLCLILYIKSALIGLYKQYGTIHFVC